MAQSIRQTSVPRDRGVANHVKPDTALFYRCVHRHNGPAGPVRTFSHTIDGEFIAARVSRGSTVPEGRYVELP